MDWIFTSEQLMDSPSRADGISFEMERGYRSKTAWFIQDLAVELKFNARLAVSTAQVLMHRFYAYQSFRQHDRYIISVAALFLAAKIEEVESKSKHLRLLIPIYVGFRKRMNPEFSADFKEVETKVLLAERLLLHTLCFDVEVSHPYRDCFVKIKNLKTHIPKDIYDGFRQRVMNILNDSYRTTLCLQFSSMQIAISAIFLVAIMMNVTPVNERSREATWLDLLESDVEEGVVRQICDELISLYSMSLASSAQTKAPSSLNCLVNAHELQLVWARLQNSLVPQSPCTSVDQMSPAPPHPLSSRSSDLALNLKPEMASAPQTGRSSPADFDSFAASQPLTSHFSSSEINNPLSYNKRKFESVNNFDRLTAAEASNNFVPPEALRVSSKQPRVEDTPQHLIPPPPPDDEEGNDDPPPPPPDTPLAPPPPPDDADADD